MRILSRLIAGSLLALSATGCLATKGDIRVLQEELRATRASVARSDSARRRTSDSLAAALTRLAAAETRANQGLTQAQQRTNDELKALTTRVTNNDIATKEQLKSLGDDLDQVRELVRQNARGAAYTRAQMEQSTTRPPAPTLPDSGSTATPPQPSGTPGPATLLVNGRSLIIQGSCTTARRSFQEVVNLYPDSPEAPEAQLAIAASFVDCGEGGNAARADSVYQVVIARYPRSEWAATALYKRAESMRLGGKPAEAKPLYEKIVCEHPRSTVFPLALNRLGGTRPATCR